jgi:hypothetical protein
MPVRESAKADFVLLLPRIHSPGKQAAGDEIPLGRTKNAPTASG